MGGMGKGLEVVVVAEMGNGMQVVVVTEMGMKVHGWER